MGADAGGGDGRGGGRRRAGGAREHRLELIVLPGEHGVGALQLLGEGARGGDIAGGLRRRALQGGDGLAEAGELGLGAAGAALGGRAELLDLAGERADLGGKGIALGRDGGVGGAGIFGERVAFALEAGIAAERGREAVLGVGEFLGQVGRIVRRRRGGGGRGLRCGHLRAGCGQRGLELAHATGQIRIGRGRRLGGGHRGGGELGLLLFQAGDGCAEFAFGGAGGVALAGDAAGLSLKRGELGLEFLDAGGVRRGVAQLAAGVGEALLHALAVGAELGDLAGEGGHAAGQFIALAAELRALGAGLGGGGEFVLCGGEQAFELAHAAGEVGIGRGGGGLRGRLGLGELGLKFAHALEVARRSDGAAAGGRGGLGQLAAGIGQQFLHALAVGAELGDLAGERGDAAGKIRLGRGGGGELGPGGGERGFQFADAAGEVRIAGCSGLGGEGLPGGSQLGLQAGNSLAQIRISGRGVAGGSEC